MKKILSVLLCVAALWMALPAQSQVRVGLKGGLNVSTVTFSEDIFDGDNRTGFFIGPMAEFSIPLLGLGVDVAALYSQTDARASVSYEGETASTSNTLKSVEIPVNLHFRTAVVHLRNFLAGSRHTQILGSGVMDIPIDLRYQRFCPDKQHGGHTARSHTRIPCLMDPGWSIFPDRMPGLPVSDPSEPLPCHQTYLSVQKEKTF